MSKINLLPEHVANQIAAGEVVEGASSVVKELVENCIDAKASKISIEIKNSNRSIKISDNGIGMSSEDLDLAFKRHATSKITDINDLLSITSNGFRGEALASIASVSKVTCITKRAKDEHASKLYIENDYENKTLTGAANGTSIHIDELFFNTPARLKFLKSNNSERNKIIDISRSLALSHPEIAISLTIENRNVLKTKGLGSLRNTIGEIFSESIITELNEINYNTGDLSITGYTASPHFNRSDKRGIFTILNNRSLKCHIMQSAVNAIYKDLLPAGKHPITILFVQMPTNEVDINVHPTKKEVKYKDGNKIYTAVGDAVSNALSKGFYQKQSEYQLSIKDKTEELEPKQESFTDIQLQPPELQNNQISENISQTNSIETKQNLAQASESQKHKISTLSSTQTEGFAQKETVNLELANYDTDKQDKLDANTKQFISRLGSVDISVSNDTKLESHISQQGNKTNYEIVARDDDAAKSVLLKGNFVGENWIKDKYLEFLNGLAQDILKEKITEQSKLLFAGESKAKRSRPSKKPPLKTLEKIWERDNYTCVYCTKALLHPKTVKSAQELAQGAFKTYLNKNNQEVTVSIFDTHTATYDHHLPASKFGVLNVEEENLYASCIECNKEKSDSLAHKTWKPQRSDQWSEISKDKPMSIGGLDFESPLEIIETADSSADK